MSIRIELNQPNAIIISIYDVLSPFKVHLTNLEKFFESNLENYMTINKQDKRIARLIKRVKKEEPVESDEKNKKTIFSPTDDEDVVLKKTVKYILEKSKKPNSGPYSTVSLIKDWLWADCLTSGKLKSTVYDYVPEVLENWRMKLFIKLFSISEADSSGQKLFLQSTQHGDLTKFFNNYIQYFKEGKASKDFYKSIANLLRDSPSNLLYITNEYNDALAAHQAGFNCVVIKEQSSKIKCEHEKIKFTNSIQNIDFIVDPNRSIDCC